MAFMPFCLSIIAILLDSLLVLPYKKGCFDYFRFSLQVTMQKPPRLPVTETGAVRLLYLCFFKRSRNYLRGFLIAAWAGAKITGFLLSRNIISFSVEPVALFSQAPRMRGKERSASAGRRCNGITPAYAGKSSAHALPMAAAWDHPRVCGEKYAPAAVRPCRVGSPPRMRGKEALAIFSGVCYRITPAYAGKSTVVLRTRAPVRDHPRVCGEKTKKIP